MLIASNNSFGQHINTSGTPIHGNIYHIDGNVGIGTNTPFYPLTIFSNVENGDTSYIRFNTSHNSTGKYNTWDIGSVNENFVFKQKFDSPWNYTNKTILTITPDGQLALGTETPNASAILQLTSTDKGILLPKLTTAQRDAIVSPANGLLIYNIDINKFSYYDAGAWHNIIEGSQLDNYLTITAFNNSIAGGITETDTTNWNNAYSWTQNFTEQDPDFNSSVASQIGDTDTANWNNTYSQINSLDGSKLVATDTQGNLTSFENGTSQQYLSTNNNGQLEWQTIEIPQASETFWERTGNKTYLKSSNDNVGIGTSNPQNSLHIFKDFGNSHIQIHPASLRLENYYLKEGFYAWNMEADKNNFNLKYGYNLKESPQEAETKFSFTEEGKLGIGKEDPQANIHIKDSENKPNIVLETSMSSLDIENENGKINFKYSNPNNDRFSIINFNPDNNQLNLMQNCTIDNKGNVVATSFSGDGSDLYNVGYWHEDETFFQNLTYGGDIVIGDSNFDKTKDGDAEFIKIRTNSQDWFIGAEESENQLESGFFIGKTAKADGTFYIENGRKVGIGTTAPSELLSVGDYFTVDEDGNVVATSFSGDGLGVWEENENNNDIYYNKDGRVGIGTTAPNELFSVNNNFTVNEQGIASAKEIKGNSSNNFIKLSTYDSYTDGGSYIKLDGNIANVIGAENEFKIVRYNGGWPTLFKIDVDGNVTISKSLWVKEDIWIQGGKPDGWADFVFEPDYELMPLSELQTYITANKHLPEVPSAEEIGDNGFKLAEMDALQMQKIEELTLYILQLQQQITEMQKEINKLKE